MPQTKNGTRTPRRSQHFCTPPITKAIEWLRTHLDQTLEEATHQLKGDYAASVKDYDHVVHHILGMADVLSDGIIAQFPAKFDKK